MASAAIEVSSRLDAPPEAVWEWVITPEGINEELGPWLKMTVPGGSFDLNDVELGRPIGRSWVLLLGLIPVDFDDITLVELERGRGFLERSRMLSQRAWEHRRTVEPTEGATLITDSVSWEPRLPFPAGTLRPLFERLFRHRHGRLIKRFGGSPAG
jgi:ligand-binding SRPBCC domain-containing protein